MSRRGRGLAVVAAALAVLGMLWPFLRPNRSEVSPHLGLETWPAVADGAHNSNTDLIHWRGAFWLVHAAAPWHFASRATRLRLWRSEDAREWVPVTEFQNPGEDIRDPKFAAIGHRLFLYWLNNRHFPVARGGRSSLPRLDLLAELRDPARRARVCSPTRVGSTRSVDATSPPTRGSSSGRAAS